ncbi:alpha-2-macroglobulin family protein [Sphingomonas montana]|uniref:alpha-2-macroglobulin family protein n=1 Tax=Sphingomonas montana TaxID=1843236 RepID=UPI001F0A71F0|nr:MG2 domain-containing protein [Sphingomonas montana]
MRRLVAFVVAAVLATAVAAGFGDTQPAVTLAVPGTAGGSIDRFTMRFSTAMVPLSGGPAPFAVACPVPGDGRWVDPATFVWAFARPLPGGTLCRATLREGLKDAAGRTVDRAREFPIDAGGPSARAVLAGNDSAIDEDQTFFVAVNGAVDRASVATGAYCAVSGIGERIPVDLLPPQTVSRVLTDPQLATWTYEFLDGAGLPDPLPAQAGARAAALRDVVALKCRRPLPPGRDMALVWGGSIRSPEGRLAGVDRRFDFTVRAAFTARLSCSRVNAAAGCSPVEPVTVAFSAPVPRDRALAVRMEIGGRQIAPTADGNGRVETLTFAAPLPGDTTARLLIPRDLRDESGRALSNARRFPLDVAIAPPPPLVKFAASFGVLEAAEGGILPVTVRAVEPSLGQATKAVPGGIARIDGDDRAIADWTRRVAKAQASDIREEARGRTTVTVNRTGDRPLLAGTPGVRRTTLTLPGGGRAFEVVGIPLEKKGFYVVELASPLLGRALLGRPATRYVTAAALVTDMAVHFKWGRGGSLVWVTALGTGKPVGGAAVRVTDSCSGRMLAGGTTDATGRLVMRGALPDPSTATECATGAGDTPPLMVSARTGGDFAFVLTGWGEGIRPYDFDLPYGYSSSDPIFHILFDRMLVRGGETVRMKHLVRMPVATGFRPVGPLQGTLVIQHSGSDASFRQPVTIGRDGIGESAWTPPVSAPTGTYSLMIERPDGTILRSDKTVVVDGYRIPTMRATVSGPKAPSLRPKRMVVDLFAGYLSGGGARGAPVRLRTAFAPLSDIPAGWDDWTFGGSVPQEGTVPMDDDGGEIGRAALPNVSTVPLTLGANGALRTMVDLPDLPDGAQLTLEMDYDDADGETLTASRRIPIYPAAIRLGIRPDGWLQRASELKLKVAALDLDGKPVAGQRVAIALYTREILSARRRLIGGFYTYDNSARTTRIGATCSATTDAQGLATCTVDPGVSGEVIAVATTPDGKGNVARAVTSTWLVGADEWWFGGDNGDRMDIQPDARSYRAGDTAHVQVRMPFRSATALVTVEREGVLSSFVTTLSGKNPVVAVPLPGSYAPNVYISVMAVRGRIGGWRLWLADFARRWNLPFFGREGAYPTALVDLAKPSFRIGIAKVSVGWDTHRLDVAVRATRSRYAVRETAEAVVQVRGPGGRVPPSAEIAFAAVDEGLLQLAPNDSWDVLSAMMAERPLAVLTSTAQMQVVGKRHYGRKAVASGGGGGGGDLSSLTRSDFRPVLLWRGRVRLDAQGRARIAVPLADALSSYRLVAIATAGGQLFGSGSTTIRTAQDLTVYPGLPPLVRSGDRFAATFTLRNGSDHAMRVTARVAVDPVFARGAPLTVTVPAGGAVPVRWWITAPAGMDRVRWTVSAQEERGPATDRVTVDERIVPAVPDAVVAATIVRIGASPPVPIAMPAGALPGRGGVDVALAATPMASMDGVRAYMRTYPWDCFEQRLSRAVVLGDRAGWARLAGDLSGYVAGDGLLRYFPDQGASGSVALTAYALSITAEAGFAWPADVQGRLIGALRQVVDGRIAEGGAAPADRRLLRLAALAALARNGAADAGMVGQVAIPLADMPTGALAEWMVTLDRVAGTDPAAKAAAQAMLRTRIDYQGVRMDLTDSARAAWWMMESADEMAVKTLLAVIGRPGWQGDAPRMAIGVAMRQRAGHWDTTPANAWGTIAAGRFAQVYPAAPAGIVRASLGAQTVTQGWPTPAAAPPLRLTLPARTTPLLLAHGASPGPWATVSLRAAVPLSGPRFAGYRIARQVAFVERRVPGRLSRGDVLRIRLTVDASVDRSWVVVEDPIPAGASIVGGRANQSAVLGGGTGDGGASYVERGQDAWRGFFGWMPRGRTTTEYVVRMNAVGRFQLPPTRVQAMYSPEIHGAVPNGAVTVTP